MTEKITNARALVCTTVQINNKLACPHHNEDISSALNMLSSFVVDIVNAILYQEW